MLVGFTCAYTPLPLIEAEGFIPYRIFPMGDQPDQAGSIMHDNLCPHVKRVLDRAMVKDLPDLPFYENEQSVTYLSMQLKNLASTLREYYEIHWSDPWTTESSTLSIWPKRTGSTA